MQLQDGPLQTLDILYPHKDLEDVDITSKRIHFAKFLYGKKGLNRTMKYNENTKE